jgi:serine/threonine protein kinase
MTITIQDLPTLSRLLDEAWDLGAIERQQWLATLSPEHERFKPTLEEMLSRQTGVETGEFVKPINEAAADLFSGRANASTPAWCEGSKVGGYSLIREIGLGGMGVVWLAAPIDGVLKRQVALKLPLLAIHNKTLAERFDRERDILASLTHPNIARLYDAGTTSAGQPYMALEYVEGLTITQHCDAQKLSIRDRIALFLQVLGAVEHAHSNLVLHRDLKPSNVLVTPEGQVKLLDFGIAKLISGTDVASEESALTQVGGQVLTPDYASPEQISGGALTTASDVYSLSVLLYEMLVGERPYKLKVHGRAALEEAIAHTEPAKASQMIRAANDLAGRADARRTTAKKFAQLLVGDLDTILAKALKKLPAARYPTVSAFAGDLQHYLVGDAVAAQPDSQWYRLRKMVGRNRLAVASTFVVMASLFTGTAVALWQASVATENLQRAKIESTRAQTEAKRAESQAERANTEATRADAESERAMILLRQAQSETVRANQLATAEAISSKVARDARTEALTQAARAKEQQVIAQSEAAKAIANQSFLQNLLRQNSTQQTDPLKAQKVTVRELLDEGATRVLADTTLNQETQLNLLETLRELHVQLGLDVRASDLSRKIVEITRTLPKSNAANSNDVLLDALTTHLATLRHSSTTPEKKKTFAEAEQLLATDKSVSELKVAKFLLLNSIFMREQKASKALQDGNRALEIFRRVASGTYDHARAAQNMATILQNKSAHLESLPYWNENLLILRKLPNNEARLIQPLVIHAYTLTQLHQYREAENNFNEALEISARLLGESHIDTLQTRKRFAVFIANLGRHREQLDMLEKLLPHAIKALGESETFHLPQIRVDTAAANGAVGNLEREELLLDLALATTGKESPNSLVYASMLAQRATLYVALGNQTKAAEFFEKSVTLNKSVAGSVNYGTLFAQSRFALVRKDIAAAKAFSTELDELLKNATFGWKHNKLNLDAEILLFEKRFADAHQLLQGFFADQTRVSTSPASPAVLLLATRQLGEAECELEGRQADGVEHLSRAIALQVEAGTERHPNMIRLYANHAKCSRKLGRIANAEASLQSARDVATQHTRLSPHYSELLRTFQ